MSETSKVQPDPNGEPSPNEKRYNWLVEGVRKLGKDAVYAWSVMAGRGSGERADTSSTIAPEATVKSGDTSPIANTMSKEQLESLRDLGVEVITTPEYPVYPEPSLPEFVTTPDGRRSPVKSGNTPATLIEPPEPTPDELARIKWNDEMRDAAAKRSVLVHPTTEEDLRELESFGVDIYSRYSPEEVSRYKDENVIDKEVFGTTIPDVDKPKKDDNPEGLTPYEQAMRDKYLGDEYDEAEYGDDKPEKNERVEDLNSEGATYVDDTPTEKIDLKTYEAVTNLKIARSRFAKASVAVESHFFKKFFGGKKRQAELEAAAEQLKQCELEYMRLKFADKIEAAKQDPEKQAELAAEMGQAALANMRETSRTTTDKYDDMLDDRNIFKKAAAKVGKWFNKGGRIAQLLKLGGTGFAVGATTATFAGWPITTAVGIVTELGVAGATKQAVLEERRGEDRIDDDSLEAIDPSFKDTVANMKIDDVMKRAVNVSIDNLKDVSIERQDALRKKVRSSLGKYGAGFALGGFAGKFAGDWANSAHATGAESNTTTPPQSGSGQIPQQPSGASSMDNSIAKTIVNNINPDTSNFNSYDYPWDWAAEKFGDANAMDQLHNLADKAMANGHTVEWFNNPDGSVWMKVDGSSVTADVLKVLNKYA